LTSNPTPLILGENIRAIPNKLLLPYDYLEIYGSFFFNTQNDDYPDYNQFGITQYLYYLSAAELLQFGLIHAIA
jgi:hypothetical protein